MRILGLGGKKTILDTFFVPLHFTKNTRIDVFLFKIAKRFVIFNFQ